MALSEGTRLGSYEILEPLGAGGMGEVYRAHDTKLDRDVALKVLPEGALSDDEARWSPDGRRLVFDYSEAGDWNTYVTDAEGGVAPRLTTEPSSEHRGAWSHDGRWLCFDSDRSGDWEVWRIPAEGEGQAVQVMHGGGSRRWLPEEWFFRCGSRSPRRGVDSLRATSREGPPS